MAVMNFRVEPALELNIYLPFNSTTHSFLTELTILSPTGAASFRFCINMLGAEFISAGSPVHLNFPESFGPHYW